MRRFAAHRSGVTLLEMLIAVALTGLILSGAYRLMISANEVTRQHQAVVTGGHRGWQTLQQMSRELRGTIPHAPFIAREATLPAQPGLRVEGVTEFPTDFTQGTVPADTIRFTTIAGNADGHGVVEYAPQQDQVGRIVGLSRRFLPAGEEEQPAPSLHNPSVVAVKFEMMDREGDWQPGWEETSLPRAVRITVWVRISPPDELLKVRSLRTIVSLPAGKEVAL